MIWIYVGTLKHANLYDESMHICRFCLYLAIYTNSTDEQKGQTKENLLLCSMTPAL